MRYAFFNQLEAGNSNYSGNWPGVSQRWSGGSFSLLVNFARNEFARPVHIHPLSPFPEFLMTRALWPAYGLETGPSFINNHFSSRVSLEAPRQDFYNAVKKKTCT